jgi:phage/conjugal plasmid C-4 type zinc finger TraR family protein
MSACEIDQSSEMQEVILEATLSNRVVYSGVSELYCVSCGCDIPEKRRVAIPGCKRCVHCQGLLERK